ncbi:sulfotransferase family protein [Filobacillus milosensis]|nr:sulfotransferase [Filobacillus milosensis]
MNKQIIVLGMHRSGTSTLALILQSIGVNMGEELLGANSGNPYGHGEDIDFLNINNKMLKHVNKSWDFPPSDDNIKTAFFKHRKSIQKLINIKNSKPLWGWKEPRTSLFVNEYHDCLSNPYYIYVERDPHEVAESLKKRNGMPIKKGLRLYERYTEKIQNFIEENPEIRILKINFKDINSDSLAVINRLIDFLEIEPSKSEIGLALKIVKPLGVVRANRKNIKHKEMIFLLNKVLHHPFRSIISFFRISFKKIKYFLGI